ncbi:MAG: penicillin-binding protein activator LpoB [Proteobacteria bacterium]|nr:penicillin-binding protein activator LpoB [Pseudomonadota bacterium]MBU1738238.1 penicillin-binding protein activator LpoB [Pseudomonadota bacterium]
MRRFSLVCCLVLVGILVCGCSGRFTYEEFLREDVDLSAVTRIAVLPFRNYTKEEFVQERVRNVAITQLLALGVADVVDRGIVDSVMAEEVIDPNSSVDLVNLKRLGQRLNVQAFLLGSIDLIDNRQGASTAYPQLAVTLRLVDAQASLVIWQSSGRWTSETVAGRIFGSAPTDSFHITLKLLGKMLKSLGNK